MTQTVGSGNPAARLGTHYWRRWWANAISSTGDGAFVAALPVLAVLAAVPLLLTIRRD